MAVAINSAVILYALAFLLYLCGYILQKRSFGEIAYLSIIAAFILHAAALVIRTFLAGHAPFSDLYEALVSFTWVIVLVYLLSRKPLVTGDMGMFVCAFSVILILFASTFNAGIKPLMPALQSNWMLIHVISYFIGYALAAVAFASSALFLILDKNKALSLSLVESTDKLVIAAFPFLTLGITTGSIWAQVAWGNYWNWDPKETWSLVTWLIYGLYLHIYRKQGWRGKLSSCIAIAGFIAILFTFLGVTLFLKGRHSYA